MGAEKYNKFLREEKSRIFNECLLRWKNKEQILTLYAEGYSPSQIANLFQHEVGFTQICKNLSIFTGKDRKTFKVFPTISLSTFARRLNELVPYTSEFHEIHLSKPQWWKIRFSHLDKTENEVKELVKQQLLDWQKNTSQKRKDSGVYNPIYTVDYWKDLSEDPHKSIEKYKREISPRCVEFWTKKGYDINEAKKRVSSVCRTGAFASLKVLRGNHISKLEQRIYELLEDSSIEQQMFLGKYAYDICNRRNKKIVEINGTYWHADPRVYADTKTKFVHGTVEEIREKDAQKISYAKSRGWDVLVVWELDYCKSPNEVIKSILGFIKNE
jgi:very-short-patch-repair endonuclease